MKVILASASPRRQELLKRLYSEFEVFPAEIDESLPEDIGPEFAPMFLSAQKAESVATKFPDDLVIAADTVVVCDGVILGKPKDREDAEKMLRFLSGKTHKVITGCCILKGDKTTTFSEESYVSFYPLSDREIKEYVDSGEAFGKAGAYAIQGLGSLLVMKIEGDFYNIVGLPIARLKREIRDLIQDLEPTTK